MPQMSIKNRTLFGFKACRRIPYQRAQFGFGHRHHALRDALDAVRQAGVAGSFPYAYGSEPLAIRVAVAAEPEFPREAIALDDTLAEAHTSLAAVYFFGDRNIAGAEMVAGRRCAVAFFADASDPTNAVVFAVYV